MDFFSDDVKRSGLPDRDTFRQSKKKAGAEMPTTLSGTSCPVGTRFGAARSAKCVQPPSNLTMVETVNGGSPTPLT
ncbi:hypothetical protein LZY01_15630 [Levilactobacillus zymae]|uniref:Uncharacterized protein n=1 Tax=Levilactobacillus zymae TaxID=267363 RepID=A0ABQ0WXU3_9LACO|nr:hypothetical protein LZY01_15630 [Levilactobacillus zymae]